MALPPPAALTGFITRHWRPLAFGALLDALSGFGQTYVISLSTHGFRSAFMLSDGRLGALYAGATFAAALTLPWAGPLIDRVPVARFAAGATLLLAAAGLVVALSPSPWVLVAGLYGLRLAGQGLLAHTVVTATARALPSRIGTALAVIGLGDVLAQACLPAGLVLALTHVGWRWTWAGCSIATLAVGWLAVRCLPRAAAHGPGRQDRSHDRPDDGPGHDTAGRLVWRDPRLWLTAPALLAVSFLLTGFLFHQARLAAEKGWSLQVLAGWFAAYTLAQTLVSFVAGPLIDRVGAGRLAPVFLLPYGAGLLVLWATAARWAAPVHLVLAAVSVACDGALRAALWVEIVGPGSIARVRSSFEAVRIVATGLAPVTLGVLIDHGVPMATQALGGAVGIGLASLLAALARRVPPPVTGSPPTR